MYTIHAYDNHGNKLGTLYRDSWTAALAAARHTAKHYDDETTCCIIDRPKKCPYIVGEMPLAILKI